ncbi:MAG: hypothetical protein EOP61_27860 [Sphingomonadales bacterium]|nr:MAG: hypothetical protein EOP61_27860 [Sphingomonadales bacterium]
MGAVANDPARREAFVEDELKLFDRAATVTYLAETCCSTLLALPPSDDIFRTVWFARRRAGMTAADCRAYYENKHRLLGEYIMNGFAYNYDRHHLGPIAPGAPEPDHAFVMEMNFPSRARFEEMAATIGADPVLCQLLAEDEARYTDRDSAVHYKAEVCVSAMPPLAMVAAA